MLMANFIQKAILSKNVLLGIVLMEMALRLSDGRLFRPSLFYGRSVTASYPLKVIPQEIVPQKTMRLELVHYNLS